MMQGIIQDLVRQSVQGQENIIREAFVKHFGFPLELVIGTGKFERRILESDPMEEYCYNGEPFLYFSREPELTHNGDRVEITHYYKMI